jgi:hypothetical protein
MADVAGAVEAVAPHLFELRNALPRAYLSGRVLPADPASLEQMVDPDTDPRAATFGPSHLVERLNRSFFAPADAVDFQSNSRVTISVNAPQPALLVFTEALYPGWRVWVDDRPAPLLAANLLFQAVAVEPGLHTVNFAFQPLYFPYFFALTSALAAAATLLWLGRGLGRSRQTARRPQAPHRRPDARH